MRFPVTCTIKDYIQPFERRLAVAELEALAGGRPRPAAGGGADPVAYRVASRVPAAALAARLAYWETVRGDEPRYTAQVLAEATVNAVRNGVPLDRLAAAVPFPGPPPLPNRRCLRYGPHGVHEYRGKFFPQLVRSLVNVAGVPAGGVVADPMCGSGTAVVEAALAGCRGLGLDMNPLSVFMSRAKCDLLAADPGRLAAGYEQVRDELLRADPPRVLGPGSYFRTLPPADQDYLTRWFPAPTLCDLDAVAAAVGRVADPAARGLAALALSNVLRRLSWQKADDLRVRKVAEPEAAADPLPEYLAELGRSVRLVLAFVYQTRTNPRGPTAVAPGDARSLVSHWGPWVGRVDAVVTSPPYATALPYLDTDRLSLCYLGLLTRPDHRGRDQSMIGNREITDRGRRAAWAAFEAGKAVLPGSVAGLVERVERLNAGAAVGFRRKNLGALLGKYFFDMRAVLAGVRAVLGPGRPAYVVVGNNRTVAGGEPVDINTAELLGDLGESVGLRREESVPMEMLVSRDIFRKNAMPSEVILAFRRVDQK